MAQAQQAGQPNREYPKKPGKNRFAHVQNTQFGMGDNYGMGVKNRIGKVRRSYSNQSEMTKRQLKTPPRSLA